MNGIIRLLASDGDGFPYLVEMFVVYVITAKNIRGLYGNSKYFFFKDECSFPNTANCSSKLDSLSPYFSPFSMFYHFHNRPF